MMASGFCDTRTNASKVVRRFRACGRFDTKGFLPRRPGTGISQVPGRLEHILPLSVELRGRSGLEREQTREGEALAGADGGREWRSCGLPGDKERDWSRGGWIYGVPSSSTLLRLPRNGPKGHGETGIGDVKGRRDSPVEVVMRLCFPLPCHTCQTNDKRSVVGREPARWAVAGRRYGVPKDLNHSAALIVSVVANHCLAGAGCAPTEASPGAVPRRFAAAQPPPDSRDRTVPIPPLTTLASPAPGRHP